MQDIFNQILGSAIDVAVGAVVGGIISYSMARWRSRKTLELDILDLKTSIERANRSLEDEIGSIKQAQASALRNAIRTSCKQHIKDGWIPLDEKQDIMACHAAYIRIVDSMSIPNGVTEDCMTQMRRLPNEAPSDND